MNACDALIGLAVNAGLAQEERTRIARQRLEAAAAVIQLKPRGTETPREGAAEKGTRKTRDAGKALDPNSEFGKALLRNARLGIWSSFRLAGVRRLLGTVRSASEEDAVEELPSTARFSPPPVDMARARRWIAQAARLDQSLSKTDVLLDPEASERLNALREKALQELEREKQEEANQKDSLPEKAISAVVELPISMRALADAVSEKAIAFLEPMESDETRPALERTRTAVHLGILKMKKGDTAGAKAEFQRALRVNCRVRMGLPHDIPGDVPVGFAGRLEEIRKETSCLDLQTVVVSAGGGTAIGVGGMFSYLMYRSHQAEHEAYVRGDDRAYMARQSDAVLRAGIADGLYVVGTAGLIYLLFFNHPPPAANVPGISVVPGPSGLVVGGAF